MKTISNRLFVLQKKGEIVKGPDGWEVAGSLHVQRFANGALGITCAGMALHLNPTDASELIWKLHDMFVADLAR